MQILSDPKEWRNRLVNTKSHQQTVASLAPETYAMLDKLSEDMERTLKKYGAVLGHMVDRVSEDWALRKTTNRPLWLQYPRRCAATAERFHGANTKWMLVPQSVRRARARVFMGTSEPLQHLNSKKKR